MSLDITWNKLLYSWSPKLLSFCLNSIQDTLPTPSNLEKWKMIPLGVCPLCAHPKATLFHILNNCRFALKHGRYNWRHDMVLRAIVHGIIPVLEEQPIRPPSGNFKTTEGKVYVGSVPTLTHDRTKLFTCSICSSGFRSKGKLKEHVSFIICCGRVRIIPFTFFSNHLLPIWYAI